MASSISISFGNFLYKNIFPIYKLLYTIFKTKQDAFEISLMNKYIKANDTVIDIGANIGFYSQHIANIVGDKGKVYSFEPDVTNFKHLTNRVSHISQIKIFNKAVAEKNQIIKIYTSKLLNVDHRTYKPNDFDQELDIEAVALDNFLNTNSVNFIKIDIQGFEMNAMRGMTSILKNTDIKLLSEFWPYGMRQSGTSVLEYFNFLKEYGFYVYLIENKQLTELFEEKVNTFLDLEETVYMNIFATKTRV